MEKLGLETTSSTPSCLAICLIREVFPAPIRPLKTQIACPEQKAITSLAASGSCSWCMRVIFFTINALVPNEQYVQSFLPRTLPHVEKYPYSNSHNSCSCWDRQRNSLLPQRHSWWKH